MVWLDIAIVCYGYADRDNSTGNKKTKKYFIKMIMW